MKRIGSLLTAGALALSLVTLPAAEAAPALEETAQAAAQAALTKRGPEHPVRPVAGWGDHPHRPRGKLFPHGEPRPHR
ncbi:hypothetical protein M5E87_28955 [Flavonifractor plautii]|nr:hypothetical protein M5E87_28955 [Flavonifractor plautii]